MTGRKVLTTGASSMDSGEMTSAAMERPAMDRWSPGNVLDTPKVDGDYVTRWIAESVNGQPTPRNVQSALKEGYTRVSLSEIDEGHVLDEDTGDGFARAGGLILMKLPKEFADQRREYYAKRSANASRAVDQLQGVPIANTVHEDRGSRALDGAEAGSMLRELAK